MFPVVPHHPATAQPSADPTIIIIIIANITRGFLCVWLREQCYVIYLPCVAKALPVDHPFDWWGCSEF